MVMPAPEGPQRMKDDTDKPSGGGEDIDGWLRALRGEDADAERPLIEDTVRRTIRAQQEVAEWSVGEDRLDRGMQRLLFRLARERAFADQGARRAPFAMAASIVVVAMLVVLTDTSVFEPGRDPAILMAYGEVDRMRGAIPDVVEVKTAQPDSAARDLAKQLEALRVPYELSVDEKDSRARILRVQFDGIPNQELAEASLRGAGIDAPDQSVIVLRLVTAK